MTTIFHTPGEWMREGSEIISLHTDEDGEHETLIAEVFVEHDWWRANARLIASAPELLEVLRLAVGALNTAPRFKVPHLDTDSYRIAVLCDRATAKATRGK